MADRAGEGEAKEIAASRNLRYVRLGKTVILERWLKEHGTPELKSRFARLVAAEGQTPIPPYGGSAGRDLLDNAGSTRALIRPTVHAGRANSCCTWDQN